MQHNTTPITPFGLRLQPIKHHADLVNLDVAHLRGLVQREHLIVLRGFRTFNDSASFASYCERWGEISLWPFGKVLELQEQENPEDHIFDNNYVPLHWDGMYRKEVPEFQIFHCVKAPLLGQGGRTTFSNTILVLKNASSESKKLWCKVTGSYQRKMEFYNSKIISPIITKHPYQNFSVLRYNEPPDQSQGNFLNPPGLEFTGLRVNDIENFHHDLKLALYSPKNFYAHEWQTGDVVIADNFTLLHGRERFVTKSPRHLQRVHVLSDPPFKNPGLVLYQ